MAKLYSDEQIAVANNVNLVNFLRMQGESLMKSGKDMRWSRHTSVTVRGNQWYEWKTEEGGYPIEFLKRYFKYDFKQAMEVLLSASGEVGLAPIEQEEPKEFILPPRSETMNRAYGYLMNTRFIDKEVIDEFVKRDLIYEDSKYHNVVFVGYDEEGVARHAHKKSTFTNKSKSFRGNVDGSDPRYTFHYIGRSNKLFVFEAPIDMLSYISLNKHNWKEHSYIALNGLGTKGLEHTIEAYSHLKLFLLCFDHDIAGIEGTERVLDMMFEKGLYEVGIVQPNNKDFNEDLKQKHGVESIKAIENPKYNEVASVINELKNIVNYHEFNGTDVDTIARLYAKMSYSYNKKGNNDFFILNEKLEDMLIRTLSAEHYLHNDISFYNGSNAWESLREDYRSYKDRDNMNRCMENIFESVKVLKESRDKNESLEIMQKNFRNLASNILYMQLNCRRELERIMEMNEKIGLPEDKRPKAKLIGEDGNIFNLMGIASKELKQAGYPDEANEMFNRITNGAESYDEALLIISQYVEPVGEDVEQDEEYDIGMHIY